jgi:hypothetical protein
MSDTNILRRFLSATCQGKIFICETFNDELRDLSDILKAILPDLEHLQNKTLQIPRTF